MSGLSQALRVGGAAIGFTLGCSGKLTLPRSEDPAALRIVSGNDQQAVVGSVLAEPLTVQVLYANSDPVPNAAVEFSFQAISPGRLSSLHQCSRTSKVRPQPPYDSARLPVSR